MAALDFPASPTNGQVFVGGNGVTYTWNGTIWLASSMASQASDTPPANPTANQLWFNSTLGQLFIYYTDANSSQWVPANPSAGPVVPTGALYLYSEQVAVGGETQLNVTIPPNTKRVELEIYHSQVSGDNSLLLQSVQSGVVFATSNHAYQQLYAQSTTVAGSSPAVNVGWNIGGTRVGFISIKFAAHPSNTSWVAVTSMAMFAATGQAYVQTWSLSGGANPATTTGFRVTLGASSLQAGSFMRAFVVT